MQRSMTLLVVLAMVLAGCTTSTPDPSPTTPTPTPSSVPDASSTPSPGRVAVVVSPEPAFAAEAAEDGTPDAVRDGLGDSELRVVTADDPSFVADLAGFFAAEGYELVCVVGAGADAAVRQVAPTSPTTRFCAAPARSRDMPDNVLAIDVRVEELGYVAGIALAADGRGGPTGVVTSSTTWAPRRLRTGFRAGLEAGGVASPRVRSVGRVDGTEDVVEDVTTLLEQGVSGILSLTGELDAAVRDVLVEVPVTPSPGPTAEPGQDTGAATPSPSPTGDAEHLAGLVAGAEAWPRSEEEEEEPALVLLLLGLHLEQAVALAVERHVDGWDTTPASVGFSDDALQVHVGSSDRAGRVATAVQDAVRAIRRDELQVPAG